jgi:hypothetical protein
MHWTERQTRGNPYNVMPHRLMLSEKGQILNGVKYDRDYVLQYFKRSISHIYPCENSLLRSLISEAVELLAIENGYSSELSK